MLLEHHFLQMKLKLHVHLSSFYLLEENRISDNRIFMAKRIKDSDD